MYNPIYLCTTTALTVELALYNRGELISEVVLLLFLYIVFSYEMFLDFLGVNCNDMIDVCIWAI